MEGVSLVPAFSGKPLERKNPIYFAHEGNRGIRSGKWKLAMKYKGPWELYDIEADRTEQHDLAKEQPELAKKLADDWEAWAKRSDVDPWTGPARDNSGGVPRDKAAKANVGITSDCRPHIYRYGRPDAGWPIGTVVRILRARSILNAAIELACRLRAALLFHLKLAL